MGRSQMGMPNTTNRPGMNNPGWNPAYQNPNMGTNMGTNQYQTSNPGGIRPILRQNLDNKPGRGPFPPRGNPGWAGMPPQQRMGHVSFFSKPLYKLRYSNYVMKINNNFWFLDVFGNARYESVWQQSDESYEPDVWSVWWYARWYAWWNARCNAGLWPYESNESHAGNAS